MSEPLPPLVPAEVDLRDFPFTPIFRARLFGSSFHSRSSDAAWRAGVTLWLKSWDQVPAGTLPADDIDLCRLAELGKEIKAWKAVREQALRGWKECTDGRLHHPVVAEGVLEAWARRTTAKQKGIAGASKRWGPSNTTGNSPANAPAIARAMPGDSKREGQGERRGEAKDTVGRVPDAPLPAVKNGHDRDKVLALRKQAIEILSFLNEKAGRNYQPVPANIDLIVARLKDGATLDDCRAIIAKKCREWATDEKMAEYLRPGTLFLKSNFWQKYHGELAPAGDQQQ